MGGFLIALGIWLGGMPVAYRIDPDPTGTRRDHIFDALAWPLLISIGLLIAGAWIIGLFYSAGRWALGIDEVQ